MSTAAPSNRLSFEKLHHRHRLSAEAVLLTAMRIGSGRSFDVAETDLPVQRDAQGRPYIPGSSFRGMLRAGLERLISGLDHPRIRACDDLFSDIGRQPTVICGRSVSSPGDASALSIDQISAASCDVCGLFGSPHLASRIWIHDLEALRVERVEIRDGVGINRDLGTAEQDFKYEVEVAPAGSRFHLEILMENADETQLAWVFELIDQVDRGELRIGGSKNRGLGRMRLEDLTLEHITGSEILDGKTYRSLDLLAARRRVEAVLEGLVSGMDDDGSPLQDIGNKYVT